MEFEFLITYTVQRDYRFELLISGLTLSEFQNITMVQSFASFDPHAIERDPRHSFTVATSFNDYNFLAYSRKT